MQIIGIISMTPGTMDLRLVLTPSATPEHSTAQKHKLKPSTYYQTRADIKGWLVGDKMADEMANNLLG